MNEKNPDTSTVTTTVEVVSAPAVEASVRIVVCAYKDSEELLIKIWEKMCPGAPVKVLIVDEDDSIAEIAQEILLDETIYDDFILVPAAVVPCAPVSFEELHLPVVYVDNKGVRHYGRMPMAVNKDKLVEIMSADDFNLETLAEVLVKANGRPVEVSSKEGNFVTAVLRGNPCEHVVMEALVRKKYLYASASGLAAITPLLNDTILKS